ncbi:MAG: DNA-3-methyladenine glycosylase I [Treponema sp.]|jgi:DNA-3-methyladenine glycosylase I|nr:DNA-3-methyladenine glycosylase I [Treponema sp.]
MQERIRCPWCLSDDTYTKYHDKEWGRPLKNDRKLFEFFVLEGAQAGLSWITILKRREGYREAFEGMNPEVIARYGERDIKRLMQDTGIIRNRRKIESAIGNARAYLKMTEGPLSFSKWLWNWVDGEPVINHFKTMKEIPASTPLSETISKDLKKRGFSFVGPTIMYAYMQAVGLVNDHLTNCFLHPDNERGRR